MQDVSKMKQTIKGKSHYSVKGNKSNKLCEPRVIVHIEQEVLNGLNIVVPIADLTEENRKSILALINQHLNEFGAVGEAKEVENLPTKITRIQTYSQVNYWWDLEFKGTSTRKGFKWFKVRSLLSKNGPREAMTIHKGVYKTTVVRYHSRR